MNPVTLSGLFHFFFWVVFPILFYWFGGQKKSNGQMCRGVIESDVAAGAVTRHRPGSAGRSILIRAKSSAGIFFFTIFVQSDLEFSAILLYPDSGRRSLCEKLRIDLVRMDSPNTPAQEVLITLTRHRDREISRSPGSHGQSSARNA
eukprot:COSAG02_NODE_15757_length_1143_cov_1.441571_2_plen_147_part_00